ncbi:MAG: Gfo/Idh/MocA family protein [Candidatus Brocadiia bacterium]
MPGQPLSRRSFLRQGSATAALLGAGALASAQGANDRLAIGCVGCGGRGSALMRQVMSLAEKHNAAITAVCDVWQVNLRRAATRVEQAFGEAPRTFTRFPELTALDDLDAVIVATPDYAHTPVMISALENDKDVYVEKPMSMEIPLANKALDLARERKRVVQVGTQRRSEGRWRNAHEELKSGVLGPISRVDSANHFVSHARWARGYKHVKEEDVDWEAFLFNRPKRPFDPKLLMRWHLFKEFTNGLSGLWMAHLVDACHMVMGASTPRSAAAHGGTYVHIEDRQHCDVFHALLAYPPNDLAPNGFLYNWAMSITNGVGTHYTVHGTQGTLDMYSLTLSPSGGPKGSKVEKRKIPGGPNQNHMENWLECIRSRQRPNADIQFGHQHAVATIMAAAARHQGRRMVYDPEKREMTAG